MPLTEKGEKILKNMQEQYGEKKGKSVLYASKNAGTISGIDAEADPKKEASILKNQKHAIISSAKLPTLKDASSPPQLGEKDAADAVASGYSVSQTSTPPSGPQLSPVNAMPAPSVPINPSSGTRSTSVGSLDALARAAGRKG